jgi:hypothetical protein
MMLAVRAVPPLVRRVCLVNHPDGWCTWQIRHVHDGFALFTRVRFLAGPA